MFGHVESALLLDKILVGSWLYRFEILKKTMYCIYRLGSQQKIDGN